MRTRTAPLPQSGRPAQSLPERVLSDPSLFPDEFKAWLPRFLNQNVNLALTVQHLPSVEDSFLVGGTNAPQFQNSWANLGGGAAPASFYRDPFRHLFMDGVVQGGTPGAASVIFTLPFGHRPQYTMDFAVVSNGLFGVCRVSASGDVIALSGSGVTFSLSGINFRQFI